MKALLTLPLAVLTFALPAAAEDACAQPTPEAMAEAAGVTLPKLPWHVANIWWNYDKPVEKFSSLKVDITIDRDVPDTYNLYISPCGTADMNGMSFYGGLQTNEENHRLLSGQGRARQPGLREDHRRWNELRGHRRPHLQATRGGAAA
jgi:hypothetical protein